MKKILLGVFLILAIFGFIWYQNFNQDYSKNKDINTLIIGTSADFPPFSFRDNNDDIVGFDIDVAKEVANRIGLNYKVIDQQFSMLLSQAQLGQIHVIAAGMTPTEERAKKLRFTKTYLTDNPLLVVTLKGKTPEIKSLQDLKSKDIIVNTGYTADLYMSDFPDINLIRLSKVSDAFTALDNGKGYAFVTAAFTLNPYLKDLGTDKYNIFKIYQTDETSALGVSKLISQELFNKIEKAIEDMDLDGTMQSLKKKWDLI
ncbi:substrate-binding periplasmic protein [Candidatus Babela massiliensis]|uniref:ABC-type amino acid transport/signal transduction system periplasmic component n=1 Tax=Candidatus Babela massiliensis TaxID=673862 RepID=V6DGU2_9BACT|nr:transporter substrate-binding domain-containing protein [Candidatus Babela massiliensis]CDK30769.1 ABC-type amino acid transport/signal transduction system periplasmic component [Candidatus Babela massiliensis]